MSAYEPVTVMYEYVYRQLADDATIDSLIGADNIWPRLSPPDVQGIHLTHRFYGPEGGIPARPMGQGQALLGVEWRVSAWNAGFDEQVLRAPMIAAHAALAGGDDRGKRARFVSYDGSVWDISGWYLGPIVTADDVSPAGVWQEVSSLFRFELRRVAA